MKNSGFYSLLIIVIIASGISRAQETEELVSMSLEDILNMNIVTVSKQAENIFDSPLSASVITREQILNSGATTFEEVFRLVPGMIVREESHGNYDIHIRGYDNIPPGNFTFFSENTMTLVMIDGRKVFNHLNGGTFWETLPISLDDIERIEIIRGPATSLYGPNAVAGVIHFITRQTDRSKSGINGHISQGFPNASIASLHGFIQITDNIDIQISAQGEQRERFDDTYYHYLSGSYVPYDSVSAYQIDPSVDQGYPDMKDRSISKRQWSGTAMVNWDINDEVHLDVSGGYQDSRAQTVFMETYATPLSPRTSRTAFIGLNASAYNFQLHVSNQTGDQNIKEDFEIVSQFDMRIFDGALEYNWEKGCLKLRPGISWQDVMFTDEPYLTPEQLDMGYLNAERTLANHAYFLRTECQPVDPLRIVAAVRTDHYNFPDTSYFNYQLAATYKVNDNNIIRGVYSRANRGPFFMDIYTDVSENIDKALVEYIGNRNLRLPLTDMAELGFRSRITDNFQMDLELFYNETRDLTSFEPDVLTSPPGMPTHFHLVYVYRNIDATVKQMGFTGNFHMTFSPKLKGRLHATVQKTTLEKFNWKISPILFESEYGFPLLCKYEERSFTHKNTPSVFGGLSVTYTPAPKWTFNAGLYCLGSHIYRHDYATIDESAGQVKLSAKLIPTLHVDYKFFKQNSAYLSLKNFFGDQTEFGFSESIGLSVFGGIRWGWYHSE